MTLHALHIAEAVLGAGLLGLLAYRLWQLPKALVNAKNSQAVQTLTGAIIDPPLADQPAAFPWVAPLTAAVGPSAPSVGSLGAGDWYDPTTTNVPQTFNEFGFITSPSPAPVDPKTGRVPLTNADVCAWVGHVPGNPCPRCGVPNA